jgi:hypothetical protein
MLSWLTLELESSYGQCFGCRPFRKLYFSGGVRMGAETCKAADIYSPHEFWSVGRIVEKELVVANEGKEKWKFETEVFSNGYKIFQFLKRPIKQAARH